MHCGLIYMKYKNVNVIEEKSMSFLIKRGESNIIKYIQIHSTYIDERCLRPLKIP